MEKKKVLIFPAGTEIAFEIFNALKYSKFVELYGGTSADDHSSFVYNNLISGFPYVDSANFIPFLNEVIKKYNIDCVYPAHDSVSVVLSKFADKINAQVIITDSYTTSVCRSKESTYDLFSNEEFIPKYYKDINDVKSFPVFVKPKVGEGSKGAKIINSFKELQHALEDDSSLLVCENLPGMEYTVDCFTDRTGKLQIVKLRDRARVRTGISVRSKLCEADDSVYHIASTINSRLKFRGAWFFQIKKNNTGEYRLLEISPRIPGTMGLSRNCGINFPLLTLFDFWNYDVSIIDNKYDIVLDRAFYSAYKIEINYDCVYVDFDDTLVVNGKVHKLLLSFLYQAAENGKKIYLLSKHKGNLVEDLKKLRISIDLFDEIIVISDQDEKYKYINNVSSIFIDDSFAERKKIKEMLGISVFDVDMVEALYNWKF